MSRPSASSPALSAPAASPDPSHLVVVGLGELGRLFGGAALALGTTVHPVLRNAPFPAVPEGTPVLCCVGEADLAAAIAHVPQRHRADVILVQNELFAGVWRAAGLVEPTVALVWFAKKKAQPVRVAQETLAFGPHASFLCALCQRMDVPARVLANAEALTLALVAKYAFILTINALGLEHDVSVGAWGTRDAAHVRALVHDAVTLGAAHAGAAVASDEAEHLVQEAMRAMADYPAKGRSAAARVRRAQADAMRLGCRLPALDRAAAHLEA